MKASSHAMLLELVLFLIESIKFKAIWSVNQFARKYILFKQENSKQKTKKTFCITIFLLKRILLVMRVNRWRPRLFDVSTTNEWINCDGIRVIYIWTRYMHTYAQHKYSTKRSQHVNKLVTWNTWDTNAWEPTVVEFTKATREKKMQRNWKKTKISTFLVDYDDLADGQPTVIAYCVLCLQYENNENSLYASLQIFFGYINLEWRRWFRWKHESNSNHFTWNEYEIDARQT